MEKFSTTANPVARLIFIHGMKDYCRALPYQHLIEYFLKRDFEVIRFDLPGHGFYHGSTWSLSKWDKLQEPCQRALEWANETRDLPVFIMGINLGALLALNTAERFPDDVQGVIAISPALDKRAMPEIHRMILSAFMPVMASLSIKFGFNPADIGSNKEEVAEYIKDPLWETPLGPSFVRALIKGMRETYRNVKSLKMPLLMLQGGKDRIIPLRGGQAFLERVPAADKTLKIYPDGCHNLFLDHNRDEIFAEVENWMRARAGK